MIWSIYCDARNFWRAADENGVPLSEKIFFESHIGRLNFVIF